MSTTLNKLLEAQDKAAVLFKTIEERGFIKPGITEKQLNTQIYELAYELYCIKKYWHKRIVRAGVNTLKPYDKNPQDLVIKGDDILFIDFGPILEKYEADYGRTYVLGTNDRKLKLQADTVTLWNRCRDYYVAHKELTGAQFYKYVKDKVQEAGWKLGGEIAGHLIGHFPHEKLDKAVKTNYIHPENQIAMNALDQSGEQRYWILEIHIIDEQEEIGGFYEQLLV